MKPKVGFYWCASCGGCEETVVDLDEKVLDVVAAVDIVFWPCALDFKYEDVEKMADGEMTVVFINGAIRSTEQEEAARLLRRKSQFVIAFGACASGGGIPALANLTSKQGILERSYLDSPSVVNPAGTLPQEHSHWDQAPLELPRLYETVYTLSNCIEVDYYLPGCPPTAELLANAVTALLTGNLPPKGSILAPNQSVCHSCSRNETKPENLVLNELKRIHEVQADPALCFLAQGILCMGPATRDGCHYVCVTGNMPCTGCFGPLADLDQGAKMIAAIGGIYQAEQEQEVDAFLDSIPDPAGTFYRYSLSQSLLGSERKPV